MQEKNIKQMAEILLHGGKMLSTHCDKCGSPLFETNGKITCPICGGELKKAGEKIERKGEVQHVLEKKLDALVLKLKEEKDERREKELLETMKLLLEVLEKLR
jgi:UPF0148 protein